MIRHEEKIGVERSGTEKTTWWRSWHRALCTASFCTRRDKEVTGVNSFEIYPQSYRRDQAYSVVTRTDISPLPLHTRKYQAWRCIRPDTYLEYTIKNDKLQSLGVAKKGFIPESVKGKKEFDRSRGYHNLVKLGVASYHTGLVG